MNLKNDSPWQRCDIYFADRNGYAGSLELKALQDNNCTKVALWTRCSVKNLKIRDNKILVPELSLELEKRFSGKIANLGKVWGPPHSFYPLDLLECVVKQSGPSGFKKGDSFRTKVSLKTGSNGTLSIGSYKYSDGIASIDILLDGKVHAKILFYRTNRNMKYKTESQYNLIVQSNDISGKYRKLKTSKVISLPSSSITMCK